MDIIVREGKFVEFGDQVYHCAIGKNGLTENKKEGDWATPIGRFPIRAVWYRPDQVEKPASPFRTHEITQEDGWCDDPTDPQYNRHVKLPYAASHEQMWRDDRVYDIVVVLGQNDDPVVPGNGSAIFLHIAREDYSPTAGCIAISREHLQEILKHCTPDTHVIVRK